MKPSYGTSVGVGAVAGLILAEALFLFFGAQGAVRMLNPAFDTGSVDPVFSIPASALWMVIIVAGAAGGVAMAAITRALARVIDPEADSASAGVIAGLGAAVAAAIGMFVFPLGITIRGTIAEGVATATVVDMIVFTAIVGIAAGAAVTWSAYILARPPEHEEDTELLAA